MRTHFRLTTIGCIVMMLLTSPLAYSSEDDDTQPGTLPSYYPSHFPKLGLLTEIRGQYDWVMDGVQIKVSTNVLVHSLVTNFSSLYSIKQGMELAYRKNSAGEIAEVWQLPDGSVDGE